MKLTFVGAAHEVTGSCHFLQAESYISRLEKKIMQRLKREMVRYE